MNSDSSEPSARRPLKSREVPFFRNLAKRLAGMGVTPNAISAASMISGIGAGTVLAIPAAGWELRALSIAAAALIQLRLMCNLMDGLVAVECGKKTPTGDLWNEVPDRISDVATLVGAGIAAGRPGLGWAVAALALMTAYVRALGASVGAGQVFAGPGAKPQRMAICTFTAIGVAIWPEPHGWWQVGLSVAGCLAAVTVLIRLKRVAQFLNQKSS